MQAAAHSQDLLPGEFGRMCHFHAHLAPLPLFSQWSEFSVRFIILDTCSFFKKNHVVNTKDMWLGKALKPPSRAGLEQFGPPEQL